MENSSFPNIHTPPGGATYHTVFYLPELDMPPAVSENDLPPPPSAPHKKLADLPDVDDYAPQSYPDEQPPLFQPMIATSSGFDDDSGLNDIPADLPALPKLFEEASVKYALVGTLTSMKELREEYIGNGNQVFVRQIDWLMQNGHVGIRRTSPDGDCLYRALGFAYLERLIKIPDEDARQKRATCELVKLHGINQIALHHGYDQIVVEDCSDTFMEFLSRIAGVQLSETADQGSPTYQQLMDAYNDPSWSNSAVWFFRLLTGVQMKSDEPEKYDGFLMDESGEILPVAEWVGQFVDPMGKDADHIMIQALADALGIDLRIAYLGGKEDESTKGKGKESDTAPVEFVQMEVSAEDPLPPIVLLYRPGHYDILDTQSTEYF